MGRRLVRRATAALQPVTFVAALAGAACGKSPPPPSPTAAAPIVLAVDARDVGRKLYHAHEIVPATAGPLTLVYPKWLPGEHAPTGPVTDLVGLTFSVAGKTLAWRRDLVDMYAFHLDVPPGASAVDVSLEFLSAGSTEGFSSAALATPHLAIVTWNQLFLYPEGTNTDQLVIQPELRLPADWRYGSALTTASAKDGQIRFGQVSVTTLVDSPVLIGEFYQAISLDASDRPVELDVAADSASSLAFRPDLTQRIQQLVGEADALFEARHFQTYHFLLTLSDHVAHFGLEHHQSNDSRVYERAAVDESPNLGVLAHEFVHSWNGKYRRPSGLTTPNFQEPMRDDLLWVYEGLTEYLGNVLAVRSGLWSERYYRERLAAIAATLDHTSGRDWRPLSDTAAAAPLLYDAPPEWASLRRGTDFYEEGWLIWLGVDTKIRELTHGERAIDDFCQRFYGGTSGPPTVRPYTLDDVVATLNEVASFDWRGYLVDRVDRIGGGAPIDGIERSGWHLAYTDTRNDYFRSIEQGEEHTTDLTASIGLRLYGNRIVDVSEHSAAFAAGLGPGMRIMTVNGKSYSPDALRVAISTGARPGPPISLEVDNEGVVKTLAVDYRGGPREPHLEPAPGRPDLLALILAERARR